MFYSCPHCRELVATDRQTRLPPAMCPRCGGQIREETPAEASNGDSPVRSFASFLRGADAPVSSAEAGGHHAVEAGAASALEELPAVLIVVEGTDSAPVPATLAAEPVHTGEFESSAPVQRDVQERVDDGSAVDGAEIIPDTGIDEAAAELAPEPPASATAAVPAAITQQATGPSFARQSQSPALTPRAVRWQWAALCLLGLLLVAQVLIADRANLAADPSWRPIVARLCSAAGCSIPAWHQPGAFTMLSRDVRPVNGVPGALEVQATFRNDARWPQRWPVLVLSLSDADGRTVGSRAFQPAEYLGAAATQSGLASGQSAHIALRLHEPDPDVVAFAFDFR